MTGKVFATVGGVGGCQALHQRLRQHRDHLRVSSKGTITNHRAAAMVQIKHRSKRHVHTTSAQLGPKHIARSRGCVHGAQCGGTHVFT